MGVHVCEGNMSYKMFESYGFKTSNSPIWDADKLSLHVFIMEI